MAAGWGRSSTVTLHAVLFLCLLLPERSQAAAPPAADEDDVTDYTIRLRNSTLPSPATLTSRDSRGAIVEEKQVTRLLGKNEGDKRNASSSPSKKVRGAAAVAGAALMVGNVQQFEEASPNTTTAPEKNTTSHKPESVSTALEAPRRGGAHLSNLLSSHTGSNGNSDDCQQKTVDSDDSEKGERTMMMMMGTILMGKMIMLMPMMILKSASELLESLLSLAMKVVELLQKLLEGKSEGGGGKNGHGGGRGEGKEATHKQVVVLQLPEDKHGPWSSGHLPHAVEDEAYGEGPHPGHGWSDGHGFHASSYHPLEWVPQPNVGASGWQHWDAYRRQGARRRAGAEQQGAGNSLAYRHWRPREQHSARHQPTLHTA